MRVLIFGGAGMLGHKLWQVFERRFNTWITVRSNYGVYTRYGIFDPARMVEGVEVFNFDTVVQAMASVGPDVVVNATGIIKQLPVAMNPLQGLEINSLLPHRLAALCRAAGARLIHLSTDCVFSGRKGMCTEGDVPDAEDLYGRCKLLGEVSGAGHLTLRTSFIGRELNTTNGLVEWFLKNQGGHVRGYVNAIYTGFPTLILAQIIGDLIERHTHISGLYHLSSDPISKYELLCLLRSAYNIHVEIEPYSDVHINHSLDSSRFRAATGFVPLSWSEMVKAMASDPTPYDDWRRSHAP